MALDFSRFEPADGWQTDWARTTTPGRLVAGGGRTLEGAAEFSQTFEMENGDRVEVVYRLFAGASGVDVEVTLDSAGDARPYSLALPFTLPEAGPTTWHFDTAGALVEFDREQLPDSARHYVTARRFVRMQTEGAGLSVATPDLPLWKFGGMFLGPTRELDPAARRPALLAWLANNYWEVNFLANQTGRTRYRLRLSPHAPEPVAASYVRTLPRMVAPRLHAYRELGAVRTETGRLLTIDGEGILIESIDRGDEGVDLVLMNLLPEANRATLAPGELRWDSAHRTALDGSDPQDLAHSSEDGWSVELPARGVIGVRLASAGSAAQDV